MSMERKLQNIMVTGGAGFMGSNFVSYLLSQKEFSGKIINLDKLTYAGDLSNLDNLLDKGQYHFIQGDIQDKELVSKIFKEFNIDTVVHFAAETHVDNSIENSNDFMGTNILGTHNLLQCALKYWGNSNRYLFHHISTDEVFGEFNNNKFTELSPYNPRNPYSASKAASDHFVKAFHFTYGLPIIITNSSNNFGPRQHSEKFIPTIINAILKNKKIPVYGSGEQVRDWIYVDDHSAGVLQALKNGKLGETYNLGAEFEIKNIDLVKMICEKIAPKIGKPTHRLINLIEHIADRPGHDKHYAIDPIKAQNDLKWIAKNSFEDGLDKTIDWYFEKFI